MTGYGASIVPCEIVSRPPDKAAFVTDDWPAAVSSYGRAFGVEHWNGWNYDAGFVPCQRYLEKPASYGCTTVVPASFGPAVEFDQPTGGRSVFSDFLEARGPGLHHLGWVVPSLVPVRERMRRLGIAEAMSGAGHGVDGDGEYAYFDAIAEFGVYLQFIVPPARRYEPHFTFEVPLEG